MVWWHWALAAARWQLCCALQVMLEDEPWYKLCTDLLKVAMVTIEMLRYLPIPPRDPSPEDSIPLHKASSVQTGSLFQQDSGSGAGRQKEKPPRDMLQNCLLASSMLSFK